MPVSRKQAEKVSSPPTIGAGVKRYEPGSKAGAGPARRETNRMGEAFVAKGKRYDPPKPKRAGGPSRNKGSRMSKADDVNPASRYRP